PMVGLEPTSPCGQQFLRLSRIPFRHIGQPRSVRYVPFASALYPTQATSGKRRRDDTAIGPLPSSPGSERMGHRILSKIVHIPIHHSLTTSSAQVAAGQKAAHGASSTCLFHRGSSTPPDRFR